jgi:hypothetical protein
MNEFSELVGLTLSDVTVDRTDDDFILFKARTGEVYRLYHEQDCCESVYIEDICGDVEDLIGSEILVAEERTNCDDPEEQFESVTWTFYTIRTNKGTVDIRWCGTSNGYYSESVYFNQEQERKVPVELAKEICGV